jgi:hypothetical protein
VTPRYFYLNAVFSFWLAYTRQKTQSAEEVSVAAVS